MSLGALALALVLLRSPSRLLERRIIEEPSQRYEPGGYHPVNVGDVYKQRYQVVQQVGWGQYSTVCGPSVCVYFLWCPKPCHASTSLYLLREQRQAAIKVLVVSNDTTGWDECGVLRTLRDQNPQALGYRHICQLLDDFVIQGPNGSHICIVTELMGATAVDIDRCLSAAIPLFLVKRISNHVLLALQYMHDFIQVRYYLLP